MSVLPVAERGGPTEVFTKERASATPATKGAVKTASRAADLRPSKEAGEVALPRSLREVQEWFLGVVSDPRDLDAAAGDLHLLEGVVTASTKMAAVDRLGVYHFAYRARLVECLADDYPALQYAIGDAFESLCHGYIAAYPSCSPSLNFFGRHFAAYCREQDAPWSAFAADLATLEWSLVEVLHAETPELLPIEKIQAIAPDAWGGARFVPSAALRVHHFDYPVNRFFQAFKNDEAPTIPERSPSAMAIYRQGFLLWRMNLTRPMASVLEALAGGEALGVALSRLGANAEDEAALREAEQNVMAWFRAWVTGGFFADVVVSTS